MPRLLAVAAVASPGGAEVVLGRLVRRLEERGWHVTVARPAPLPVEVVGVPVERTPPAPPPWRTDRPVVGFVGRLEPAKGPLDLIRAAPAIARARPDARIVLVGSDPFTTESGYREAVRA